MSAKNQHVVPYKGLWAVRQAGNRRVSSVHNTQRKAKCIARKTAIRKRSELLIHGKNGRIRERSTYGHDPFPPNG